MRDDLKAAFRSFRSSMSVTAVALVVLTLGIGASTAIFSVVDAVVLARCRSTSTIASWPWASGGRRALSHSLRASSARPLAFAARCTEDLGRLVRRI
jgi:hypothetical protein